MAPALGVDEDHDLRALRRARVGGYNLALGERRAAAVKAYLQSLGVAADRMQVVSYGKEKPFCSESNETCWAQNRRGHFLFTVK